MSEFRVGEDPVLSGLICLPRVGAWYADLTIDTDTAPTGSVTLSVDSDSGTVSLVGHAVRSDVYQLKAYVRLVGGAGGFLTEIDKRYYVDVQAKTVLNDLLRDAGETASNTADTSVQSKQVGNWTRPKGLAGLAFAAILRNLGVSWRVLPDGTVWYGTDDFSTTVDIEFDLLDSSPTDNRVLIATNAYPDTLLPGTTFMSKHVSALEHEILPSQTRTKVWFEDS